MGLPCKEVDFDMIVGELPGCEVNIGRIVQVRRSAKFNAQCGGLICLIIRPVNRKKMINLYDPNMLINESVTWKFNIKLPNCWLLPIRPSSGLLIR